MGQRNRSVDLEMEQQQQQQQSQASLQPGPCLLLGGSFPQPVNNNNIPAMVPNSLQDNAAMFYGLPQYHHHHHHHQPAPTNYYPSYVPFQATPTQLPPPSSYVDHEYERNAHFMDHTPGAFKRKNAEGPQYLSPLPVPFNNPPETAAPFGGARSRPGAVTMNPVLPHHPPPALHAPNGFIQGNYAGPHPFPPPGSIWYDQHHGRPDGPPPFWPHSPYMQGSNIVAGSIESSSRNPAPFMYPPQLNPEDLYYHPPPPPVQGVRGQSATLYPPMASSPPFRVPFGNFAPQNLISSGPVQPAAFRLYQHLRGDGPPPLEALRQHREALRQHRGGVPRLRVMPDDEVAMLEFGDFLGNNHIDHHQDMRLDIEEMSYEELLALSERIGTVNIGLSEEDVKNHLKTRTCSVINLAQTKDRESEPCTICQESFKNEEKIATLDCGHEYHAECLEKWLVVKNVCPICKSEALVMEKRSV